MKSRSFLLYTILATTAGLGASSAALSDQSEGSTQAATALTLGDHPAVVIARTPKARGIDPNTFIVAHPARLELLAVSPSDQAAQLARAPATATTGAAGR